jgi:regulator of sirC expression with transglutaminase-like and TPR domain
MSKSFQDIRTAFSEATNGANETVDLLGAALAIARIAFPDIETVFYSGELEQFSSSIRQQVDQSMSDEELINLVNIELFQKQGFRGNKEDYYNPENSYLNRVLDRRLGIPLTLSLIYMEVAERIGLKCEGIGFPSHFLVRCGGESSGVYVDVFNEGQLIARPTLDFWLEEQGFFGSAGEPMLAAITRRQIIQRMLVNLRLALRRIDDFDHWLLATELQLVLEPWSSALFLERGMVHFSRKSFKNSYEDLSRYIELEAVNPDKDVLRIIEVLKKYHNGQ